MDTSPGMASTSVSSRFVSQTQLTEAQKKREEDIRAAYARMGQSPPPEALQAKDEVYDPRSLYEKLKSNSDAKQEAFEEKTKLSNQFRGIDDAESDFLAQVAKEKREQQMQREREMREELERFRQAALEKEGSPPSAVGAVPTTTPSVNKGQMSATKAEKSKSKSKGKRKREGLLGVVKKKEAAATKAEEGGDDKRQSLRRDSDAGNGEKTNESAASDTPSQAEKRVKT